MHLFRHINIMLQAFLHHIRVESFTSCAMFDPYLCSQEEKTKEEVENVADELNLRLSPHYLIRFGILLYHFFLSREFPLNIKVF